jgi:hypothetical protein
LMFYYTPTCVLYQDSKPHCKLFILFMYHRPVQLCVELTIINISPLHGSFQHAYWHLPFLFRFWSDLSNQALEQQVAWFPFPFSILIVLGFEDHIFPSRRLQN